MAQSAVQAGKAAEIAAERKFAKYSGLSSSHIFIPVAVKSLGPLADDAHRQKNDFQHSGSARNGVPVPAHLSGDSTLQRRVSYKHFHFRSVVVIPDIIIFIVIIVIMIIIIINIIMFVYSIDDITRIIDITNQHPPRMAALYTEGLSWLNCCHTRRTAVDNRTGLTS